MQMHMSHIFSVIRIVQFINLFSIFGAYFTGMDLIKA
jgi:hypothetical protein